MSILKHVYLQSQSIILDFIFIFIFNLSLHILEDGIRCANCGIEQVMVYTSIKL